MDTDTGKLVYELKTPIKIVAKNAPEPVEVRELVLKEPNRYNLDEFYDFQAIGLELFRKALDREKQKGSVEQPPAGDEGKEQDYKDIAQMIRVLVFSSYSDIKPSDFIKAFKKVIFNKNRSYITSMDESVSEHQFMNAHRDDIAKMACEYFAFFALSDFME